MTHEKSIQLIQLREWLNKHLELSDSKIERILDAVNLLFIKGIV